MGNIEYAMSDRLHIEVQKPRGWALMHKMYNNNLGSERLVTTKHCTGSFIIFLTAIPNS